MTKLISAIATCALVILLIASVSSAAPNWKIQFTCTAPDVNDVGNVYFGAVQGCLDGRDGNDQVAPKPIGNYLRFAINRPELGGTYIKQDLRALFSDATKVWANLVIEAALPSGATATLAWKPGEGTYSLPQGSFTLVDLTNGVSYDVSTPGSAEYYLEGSGELVRFCLVAKIGAGPNLSKIFRITGVDLMKSSGTVLGYIENQLYAYFGDELRRLNKVDLNTGVRTTMITAPGQIRVRPCMYADIVYATDTAGNMVWADPVRPGTAGVMALDANSAAVPSAVLDGAFRYIYVGTNTGLKRVKQTSTSMVHDRTFTLGVPMNTPAVPDMDLIWCGTADGNLYCLNGDLNIVRAVKAIGGSVGDPMVDPYAGTVSSGGGNIYGTYDAMSFDTRFETPIGGNVTSPPYVDFVTKVSYFLSDDNKVNAVNTATGAIVPGWPLPLDGVATRSPAPVVGEAKVIASGGIGDNKLYIFDKGTTAKTGLSGNGSFVGAPSFSPDTSIVVVPNTDGNLYVIDTPHPEVGPIISDVASSAATETSAVISWTTNVLSDSQVMYGPNGYTSSTTLNPALVTSHSQSLTGLTPGTTYHYCVLSRDYNGNLSSSPDFTVVTVPAAPVVTDDGAYTTNTAQLSASWSAVNGATEYQYAIGTTVGGTEITPWTSVGTATSVTKTGLSLATGNTYYIQVKAKNSAGAWGVAGSSNGIQIYGAPGGTWNIAVLANGLSANWTSEDLSQLGSAPYSATSAFATLQVADIETSIANHDVLILPNGHSYTWLTTANTEAIRNWVSAGGTLVIQKPSIPIADELCDAFGSEYYLAWGAGTSASVSVLDANNVLVKNPNVLTTANLTGWTEASNLIQSGGSAWRFATQVSGFGYVSGYAQYGAGVIVATGTQAEKLTTTDARKVIENLLVVKGSL